MLLNTLNYAGIFLLFMAVMTIASSWHTLENQGLQNSIQNEFIQKQNQEDLRKSFEQVELRLEDQANFKVQTAF